MVTGWTILIVFAVAFGNAWVAMIGVRIRMREGMRLYANDQGYYLPPHFGHMGFYRGFYINLGFAGTSFALAAACLQGDSSFCGREPIIVIAVLNFLWSIVVACMIPSDFDEVLSLFRGKFWRVFWVGLVTGGCYFGSGIVIGNYVSSLRSFANPN